MPANAPPTKLRATTFSVFIIRNCTIANRAALVRPPPGPGVSSAARSDDPRERFICFRVPTGGKLLRRVMSYPWPLEDADVVLQEALDIALDYLGFTERACFYSETQRICAHAILNSWRRGTKHRIRLASDAIHAIEKRQLLFESFYPKFPEGGVIFL
jgi:hypothetical protein